MAQEGLFVKIPATNGYLSQKLFVQIHLLDLARRFKRGTLQTGREHVTIVICSCPENGSFCSKYVVGLPHHLGIVYKVKNLLSDESTFLGL